MLKRAAKASYYTAILNEYKYNIKSTWNVLRQAINKQKHVRKLPHTFIINGVEISNSEHIGEEFNNYFVGIGQSLSNSIPLPNITYNNYLHGHWTPPNTFFHETDRSIRSNYNSQHIKEKK